MGETSRGITIPRAKRTSKVTMILTAAHRVLEESLLSGFAGADTPFGDLVTKRS